MCTKKCDSRIKLYISILVMIISLTLLIIVSTISFDLVYGCHEDRWSPKLRKVYQHNGYWVISNFVQNENWGVNKCTQYVTYTVQGDYKDIYKLERLYTIGYEDLTSFAVYVPNVEYMIQTRIAIAYVRNRSVGIRNYVSFHLYFSYDEELPFESLVDLAKRNLSFSGFKNNIYTTNDMLSMPLGNFKQRHTNYIIVGKNIAQLETSTIFILNGDLNYYPKYRISVALKVENQLLRVKLQKRISENMIWRIPVILTRNPHPYNHTARLSKYLLLKFSESSAGRYFLSPIKGDPLNLTVWLNNYDQEISNFTDHYEKFLRYRTFYIINADSPLLDEAIELTYDQSENLRMYTLGLLKYKYVDSFHIYLLHTIDEDNEISHNQFNAIDEKIRLEYDLAYNGRLAYDEELKGNETE